VNAPAGEGAALIAMNDTHAIDVDKNDFIVSAKPASTSVPEPATLMGLGVVTSGFLSLRRRKAAQAVKA
jgi:glutathione synthase/RimK-type ligase-like ATP-grasp enzyme